jgi:hypothetical protein
MLLGGGDIGFFSPPSVVVSPTFGRPRKAFDALRAPLHLSAWFPALIGVVAAMLSEASAPWRYLPKLGERTVNQGDVPRSALDGFCRGADRRHMPVGTGGRWSGEGSPR